MFRPLFHSVFKKVLQSRQSRIAQFSQDPHRVQTDFFQQLLNKGRQTQFGNEYGFSGIRDRDDWREKVPISDYEDLKPWIQKAMQGEADVLWPGSVKWFSKSSGTTSDKSKFIPVTNEALWSGHYAGGRDVMASYIECYPKSKIYHGRGLLMGGSAEVNEMDNSSGSKYGDISAVMMVNMPRAARWISAPDLDTLLMNEWEAKIEQIAIKTINSNITHIAGVPTWTIVLIRKLFEMSGENDLKKIWPNLELYLHGGVSFEPYRQQFDKLIPHDDMHYLEIYNASEGFIAFQDQKESKDLLLATDHGIYYEFIRLSDLNSSTPKIMALDEVEAGVDYAILISTNAGLWRYLIGDTIKFTSINPYRLRVSGRTKHFINAFGEEVMVSNTDRALAIVSEKLDCNVKEYTVAPVYMEGTSKGGHEWIIEFEREPKDVEQFMKELDSALQSLNSDYEAKRYKDMALLPPKYTIAKKGTFYKWLKSKGKLGGQNKVPRLSNDRHILEELLKAVNV